MPRGNVFDKRTLRERCTMHVRQLIITGSIKPGDHVVETALSEELGVSRGTLREALRPLTIEGLLVDDGRGHLLVRQLTGPEIREVFQVREALEALAATTLTLRDDRAESADRLRRAIEPLRDDSLEFGRQIEVDLGFHELMCELTGNSTLVRTWGQLVGQIEMMIIAAGTATGSLRMRYEDHTGIVDAIASGDPDAVRAELARHMDRFATTYQHDYELALDEAS
jgi:DNA-binding GntR family transcriptional regulator